MVFDIFTFVEALWIILPAYAANGLVPLVGLRKGLHPIDGGRSFRGGRILGDGKSWEGLILGAVIGMVIGIVEMLAFPYLPWGASPVPLEIVAMTPLLGFLIGLGAMVGDAVGSFIKRRIGLRRGDSAPILDQDDFVVGALVFASIVVTVSFGWLVLLLILTPVFHYIASFIGYKVKVKKTPW
jgi:CDP-2,3-bis-(O-geranylgeranyl)-sn-glycerol synthase